MNVSKLFRADIVSASFDEAASREAASGRTDTVRSALSAQWGITLPAKKAGFISAVTEMIVGAAKGDTLCVRSYKERATVCAILALTVAELEGTPSSVEAELTRFMALFAPKKRAAATPAAATPAIADAMAVVLTALRSGTMTASNVDALRSAMAAFDATTAAALM